MSTFTMLRIGCFVVFWLAAIGTSRASIEVVRSNVENIKEGTMFPDDWKPTLPPGGRVEVMIRRPNQPPVAGVFETPSANVEDELDPRALSIRGRRPASE